MRYIIFLIGLTLIGCMRSNEEELTNSFKVISEVNIEGGKLAAEISAYDIETNRLFVSNNAMGNRVDIIDIEKPITPTILDHILLKPWPDERLTINSLAVEGHLLAVSVSATNPQEEGYVFIFNTKDFSRLAELRVGAMPDMVGFTPDAKYIVTANEGEPNTAYTNDPEGSVSIIDVSNDFKVNTINFDGFENKREELETQGFRIFGPNASFSQDIEPEYVAFSSDSKYAYVTLQENNGIAKFDIKAKKLIEIYPLGFKNFMLVGNEIDICDNDEIATNQWPIFGIYQPDALAFYNNGSENFIITANEGDSRNYKGYSETSRVNELTLDQQSFPESDKALTCDSLGRLIVTTTLGDTDGDGDFDQLYTFGTRSFSIWNAEDGKLVFDSQNMVEQDLIANSSLYDDKRSDDKGTEPESLIIGSVNATPILFVALERANALVTYDLTDPLHPKFLQVLETGIGPEGILFVSKKDSPNGKSLLIVSSEVDGKIKLYQPQ